MRIQFVDVFVSPASSRTHTTSETDSHDLLARRDPVVVGSHAKWLPVAHATPVLFMSSNQSQLAGLLSPQNVPETVNRISPYLSPSLMEIEDSLPESCGHPCLSSWVSLLLCPSQEPPGTVDLVRGWP